MIIHNWRACVVCPEEWQNWMIEKCKLSAGLRHGQLYLLLEPRSGSACVVFWFALTSRKFHDVHILMIWADLMEGPGIAWFTNGSTVRLYVWLKELHNWFLFTQEPLDQDEGLHIGYRLRPQAWAYCLVCMHNGRTNLQDLTFTGRGRGPSDLASQVYMINCFKALLQSSSIIK